MFRITKIADFIHAMKELLTKKAHCSSWIQCYHWFEKKHHLGISIVCDHLSFYFKTETGFSRSKSSLRPVHFNALEVSINTSFYIIMQQNCSQGVELFYHAISLAKFWFPREEAPNQTAGYGISHLGFEEPSAVVPGLSILSTVGRHAHRRGPCVCDIPGDRQVLLLRSVPYSNVHCRL